MSALPFCFLPRHLYCCATSVRCRVSCRFGHALAFIIHPWCSSAVLGMDRASGDHRPAALLPSRRFSVCGMLWAVLALR